MISGQIALAFTAGMIAAFNPCGFALLPAYLGAFVSGEDHTRGQPERIARALQVSLIVAIAFVLVFTIIGVIIDSLASTLREQLPWVTIIIGITLIFGGILAALGRNIRVRLPGINRTVGGTGNGAMFAYGITFAVASLSCTIGPFLVVTGSAVSASWPERVGAYIAYALGMGTIIAILSIAAALAHASVAAKLRRFSQIAPRVGGVLMIVAGAYAVWYGRWELDVYSGSFGRDGVVETGENIRSWFISTIGELGPGKIVIGLPLVLLAVLAYDRFTRRTKNEADTDVQATS